MEEDQSKNQMSDHGNDDDQGKLLQITFIIYMHKVILVVPLFNLLFSIFISSTDLVTSRDGTAWRSPSLATSRVRAQNILHQQGGTKQFIRARVGTPSDIFLELFGQQFSSMIQKRTLEEEKRQENDEFQLSIEKPHALIGLSIIRGVIKDRDESLYSFWNSYYERPIFGETMAKNNFIDIMQYIRFDDKRTRPRRRENDKYALIRKL